MANNLQRHERRDKSKWAVTFIAILLAFVAIAAAFVGIFSDGFTNWDKFKPDEEQTEQTEETADNGAPVTDENGDEISSDAAIPMPKAMTFRSAAALDGRNAAYDSVTVNATVKPEGVDLKSFVFTVEWVNPASEWATGKTVTDYFTVTPTAENSLQATLQCLQPFGEQIKVLGTGTSLDDAMASAECTIDFAKRIESVSFSIENNFDTPGDYVFDSADSYWEIDFPSGAIAFFSDITYTSFTVDDTFDCSANLSVDDDVLSGLNSDMSLSLSGRDRPLMVHADGIYYDYGLDWFFAQGTPTLPSATFNIVKEWLGENPSAELYVFSYSAEGTYSDYSFEVPLRFSAGTVFLSIQSVSFDQSNIII